MKTVLDMAHARWHREVRLKELRRVGAGSCLVGVQKGLLAELKAEMASAGISEAVYRELVGRYWMEWSGKELSRDRAMGCVHFVRACQYRDGSADCIGEVETCFSCDCYEALTVEQERRHAEGLDIDTGEDLLEG